MAAISGVRRPSRSLSGPISNWPSASPATHAVSVSWTGDALVSQRSRAISGNAGRYMSIDSGPIALTEPEDDHEAHRGAVAHGDCGNLCDPRLAGFADGGGTTGPMSPSGASSRSTITGA